YEGIIESDTWLGPLFTNVRLTRTNSPVEFHVRYPLFQVQPLLRRCYEEPSFEIADMSELTAEDWDRFAATLLPNTDQMRMLGHHGDNRGHHSATCLLAAGKRRRVGGGDIMPVNGSASI